MNDKLVSSLTAVFLVMQSSGQYSDRHSSPVKSFASREAADRFLISKEGETRRLEGMKDAINAMHAEWQKVNPAPFTRDSFGYENSVGAAYEAWHSLNSAEVERLETITGYREAVKEAGLSEHDDLSYICYYISEVPFQS